MTGKKAAATLSNTAKQIIASKGGPLPQFGREEHSRLVRLLNDIHAQSSVKSSRNALLTLATGTIVTLNSPSALRSLWEWSGKSRSDALLMRESALKSISFIGIAKVINNLAVLQECFTKSGIQDSLPSKSRRDMWSESMEPTFHRGRALWNSIYTPYSDKLVAKLATYHPDLPVHILESHYSLLLSDPESDPPGPLGRTLTSVLAIACLQAQMGVGGQATSHVFGLKKALAEKDSTDEALSQQEKEWLCGDAGTEWVLESIEALREVISGNARPRAKL